MDMIMPPLRSELTLIFRAANAAMAAGGNTISREALTLLDLAITKDPMDTRYYLARARYLLANGDHAQYAERIWKDFARALELDPNEVSLHVEYADALRELGDRAGAVKEYEAALKYNEMLKKDEPKRLRPERVEEIRRRIGEMRG
jgi:tetratricopeptide (TPR) repeat protein